MDLKKRSFAKALTWRVLATLTTMIIVYLATGNLNLSLSVGVLDVLAKLIIYYFHERAWLNVKWGKGR